MVFIQMSGGKSKRLKGKRGGDKYDANARYRRDERNYTVESKLSAERKSARRGNLMDTALVSTSVADSGDCLPKGKHSFVTDDGNTRVTIRYDADGKAVCAHIRPARNR